MAKIKDIIARQIFDSRGNPTVEVDVITENLITEELQFLLELLLVSMKPLSYEMEVVIITERGF